MKAQAATKPRTRATMDRARRRARRSAAAVSAAVRLSAAVTAGESRGVGGVATASSQHRRRRRHGGNAVGQPRQRALAPGVPRAGGGRETIRHDALPPHFSESLAKPARCALFPYRTVKRLTRRALPPRGESKELARTKPGWSSSCLERRRAATKQTGPPIQAWTSLVRQGKIWQCPLGQQCCPNGGGHGACLLSRRHLRSGG